MATLAQLLANCDGDPDKEDSCERKLWKRNEAANVKNMIDEEKKRPGTRLTMNK